MEMGGASPVGQAIIRGAITRITRDGAYLVRYVSGSMVWESGNVRVVCKQAEHPRHQPSPTVALAYRNDFLRHDFRIRSWSYWTRLILLPKHAPIASQQILPTRVIAHYYNPHRG